jgi:hypothetical protein
LLSVSQFQGSLDYSNDVPGQAAVLTTGASWLTPARWARFAGVPVTAMIGRQNGALQSLQLGALIARGSHGSINTQLQWTRRVNAPGGLSLGMTYNAYTGRLRQSVSAISSSNQATAMNFIVGSMATIDPPFDLTSSDRSSANAASITGRAFYDEDGDGVFGAGDRPAQGAIIQAGGLTATAGVDGRYRLLGILPYEPVKIVVDTVEGFDPSYVPTAGPRDVRLSPNVFTHFDVALVKTREVVGTLAVADTTVPTAAGVTVELRETANGRTYTTSTFADGAFYVSRIVPGEYRLSVAAKSLAALKATVDQEPVIVHVSAKGDAAIVAPTITLHGPPQVLPVSP